MLKQGANTCQCSGAAAEKFAGSFIQDAEDIKVDDPAKIEELFSRTPGYTSWQGEQWLAACFNACIAANIIQTLGKWKK
ncbi:CbrC family protein [Paenibacillus sp. FSL R7-0204]|uniref:CbrC family protein n=1 Tax=Paenibacillus sp. FSL R7-0204 TaxID=2921675 RepID=UPI0030F4E5A7